MRWLSAIPLFAIPLLIFPVTASAVHISSVDDRADAISQQLKGNHSYHAYLARNFADYASEELGQHDLKAARAFIKMAEEEAAQAGAAK